MLLTVCAMITAFDWLASQCYTQAIVVFSELHAHYKYRFPPPPYRISDN